MRRLKMFRKTHLKEEMSLQITSMADIFTILLVYLLKSFSIGATTITPSNEILLPVAKAEDEIVDTLKIEISPNVILVDDKPITVLKSFRFDPADIESNYTPRSLNSILMSEKVRRQNVINEVQDQAEKDKLNASLKKIMILSDESAPYKTVKGVLTSAGSAGFIDFKLVVVQK